MSKNCTVCYNLNPTFPGKTRLEALPQAASRRVLSHDQKHTNAANTPIDSFIDS